MWKIPFIFQVYFSRSNHHQFFVDAHVLEVTGSNTATLWKCNKLMEKIADASNRPPMQAIRNFSFLVSLTGNDYLPTLRQFSLVCLSLFQVFIFVYPLFPSTFSPVFFPYCIFQQQIALFVEKLLPNEEEGRSFRTK